MLMEAFKTAMQDLGRGNELPETPNQPEGVGLPPEATGGRGRGGMRSLLQACPNWIPLL